MRTSFLARVRESKRPDYALAAIVRRKDKDGVVFQAQVIDRVLDFTHVGVRLCENVSKTSVSRGALKVGMGIDRLVGLRIREIGEERLLSFSLALDEINGVIGNFTIDRFCASRDRTPPASWAFRLALMTARR